MPLIEETLFGQIDKVKMAIERIKTFDPSKSELLQGLAPYYVAYSGGKDSDVLRILFELADVKHDLVHNHTTVDAPETVYYIRTIPNVRISMPDTSMWDLISAHTMPPTRLVRYCCKHLKERSGKGRFVATGVRWSESRQRSTRGSVEVVASKKAKRVILSADNDESRRLMENCTTRGTRVLNPIIDWTDSDVWEFLKHYNCDSNPLYKRGKKRIGCIGCPMTSNSKNELEKEYPKYKSLYIKAFDRMLKNGKKEYSWTSGEEVCAWWTSAKAQKINKNQMSIEMEG